MRLQSQVIQKGLPRASRAPRLLCARNLLMQVIQRIAAKVNNSLAKWKNTRFTFLQWHCRMHGLITPVLIPGLFCTAELFRDQLQAPCDLAVRDPAVNAPAVADTLSHDSMEAMAVAALTATKGPAVAIGL